MAESWTALSEAQFAAMQGETFVLLHTIDAETGSPTTNAISWIYAPSPTVLRFAVDGRSRLVNNLKQHPACCVTLFAGGTVQAVYGTASVVTESLEGVPFRLVCFDIKISAVRDAMFYGARLTALPEYEKTYDQRAADKLDRQVFEAMRKA